MVVVMEITLKEALKAKRNKKSQYSGVIYVEETPDTPWWAYSCVYEGLCEEIGRFSSEREAVIARDKELYTWFNGRHVKFNFPDQFKGIK